MFASLRNWQERQCLVAGPKQFSPVPILSDDRVLLAELFGAVLYASIRATIRHLVRKTPRHPAKSVATDVVLESPGRSGICSSGRSSHRKANKRSKCEKKVHGCSIEQW